MEVEGGCGVSEVENRRKRGEERCVELELEIVKRKSEYEALEAKYRALEREKVEMEEEIRVLKRGRGEVKEQGNGGGDEKETLEISVGLDEDNVEEDGVFELMVENETLEIEKKNAESEVEAWRRKFKELERWVLNLDKDLVLKSGVFPLKLIGGSLGESRGAEGNERMELEDGLKIGVGMGSSRSRDIGVNVVDLSSTYQSPGIGSCHLQAAVVLAGTPTAPYEHRDGTKERMRSGMEYGQVSLARKLLEFKEDRSPCKKMAPPTPGGGIPKSLSVIDISDSDDELTIADNQIVLPTDNKESRKIPPIKSFSDQENVDAFNEEVLAFSTPKRKRASNVVDSDSESSDDNIPIAVKKMHLLERKHDGVGSDVTGNLETASAVDDVSVTSPKRRLVRLTKCGGKCQAQRSSSQTGETKIDRELEEDEPEEVGSDSEGESLGGFIVNSSDDSEINDASSESNNVSDDDVNFEEVLSTFRRNKDNNTKWEFEADMLAAFGKDPELCMKAVCALYRQQSSEEQAHKETFLTNSRGFSKFDALRGSKLADFLTDGDPNGDLKKTVEELEKRDPMAIELCRDLASRYSKQLFEIYKNKEDSFCLLDGATNLPLMICMYIPQPLPESSSTIRDERGVFFFFFG